MKYGELPSLEKPVSRIVLGTMIINTREQKRSFALLDAACRHDVIAFDTARVYAGGDSERALGRWMKARGNRDQIVIISKGAHPKADLRRVTPFDITADLRDSLARLQTEYIDIYLLHRDDPNVPVGPIVEILNEHQRAGRIRVFGGSNWTHDRLQMANDYAATRRLTPFLASSPNFGLAEQVQDPWGEGCVTISGPAQAAAREWYRGNKMAVFAYSSLGRGFFSGRITRENFPVLRSKIDGACLKAYCHEVNFRRLDRAQVLAPEKGVSVAQIAMAFIFNQPLNVFALVGAETEEEIEANVAASEMTLSPAEVAWLNLECDQR